jgi:hypothetical protein
MKLLSDALRARLKLALAVPFVLAACGGGAATSAPGATTGAAPTAAGATQATGATSAPAAGGGAEQWCLNTVDEVEAAIGTEVATASGNDNAGAGGGCIYSDASGNLLYSVAVVTVPGHEQTYEAGKTTPGAVEISGIGNGAVLISPQGPLVILTDRGLISLGPTTPAMLADAAAYRTAAETLGRQAVGRLP